MCSTNSAYKMHLTGSGSGSLKRAAINTFPWRGKFICSSSVSLSGVRSKPHTKNHFVNISIVIMCVRSSWRIPVREKCFGSPTSNKGWRIHSECFGTVLNSVYVKEKICHIIIMKVEWICTDKTDECGVFNEYHENHFRNWSSECIIDTLAGPQYSR